MSNSLFENPKIALGFAGGVVAIALVASVALNEFGTGQEPAPEINAVQSGTPEAPANQANSGFASQQASGWAGETSMSDDWAPQSASVPNAGFNSNFDSGTNPDEPVIGDYAPTMAKGNGLDRSGSGPTITSKAAPGAPEVVPPSGAVPEIEIAG